MKEKTSIIISSTLNSTRDTTMTLYKQHVTPHWGRSFAAVHERTQCSYCESLQKSKEEDKSIDKDDKEDTSNKSYKRDRM